MPEPFENPLLSELEALKRKNAELRKNNEELRKDCISFAKLIKANTGKDKQIKALSEELNSLKSKLEELKYKAEFQDLSSESSSLSFPSREEVPASHVKYMDEESYMQSKALSEEEDEKEAKKGRAAKAKRGFLIFSKVFISILLCFSLLVSLISGVSCLFSLKFPDLRPGGLRFASVFNDSLAPEITKDDVVLIKYCGFEGLSVDSVVITKKDGRSAAILKSLSVKDGEATAAVEDRNGSYDVSEEDFVGRELFKLPLIGTVVRYASENRYNYAAILLSLTLMLCSLLLILPPAKREHAEPNFRN